MTDKDYPFKFHTKGGTCEFTLIYWSMEGGWDYLEKMGINRFPVISKTESPNKLDIDGIVWETDENIIEDFLFFQSALKEIRDQKICTSDLDQFLDKLHERRRSFFLPKNIDFDISTINNNRRRYLINKITVNGANDFCFNGHVFYEGKGESNNLYFNIYSQEYVLFAKEDLEIEEFLSHPEFKDSIDHHGEENGKYVINFEDTMVFSKTSTILLLLSEVCDSSYKEKKEKRKKVKSARSIV